MGWVDRLTPWFAVVVIVLAAASLAIAVYDWLDRWLGETGREGASAALTVYAGGLVGAICMVFVAVRVAAPGRRWPSDGAVRALATVGLIVGGMAAPLIVLRGDYGIAGVVVGVVPLIVYYVRLRKPLVDILPSWCGGTWKPDQKRRRPRGDEVVKRPPSAWDETSGPRASDAPAGARPRRKQSKKKRRSGR